MKIRNILFVIGVAFSQLLLAQQTLPRDPDCCTSIMVGKLASTDGRKPNIPTLFWIRLIRA